MDKVVADENILSLCNTIGILYDANYWPSGFAHIVADSEFYNEKLSKCLDIKKEYQHWQSVIHPESERYIVCQVIFCSFTLRFLWHIMKYFQMLALFLARFTKEAPLQRSSLCHRQ